MLRAKIAHFRVRLGAADLLRLVREHNGHLPICLDPAKAGVELLGNMLLPKETLLGTVQDVELPHEGPYQQLLVGIDVWLSDGKGGETPMQWLETNGPQEVRAMIVKVAADRAAAEGGLRPHPLESEAEPVQ